MENNNKSGKHWPKHNLTAGLPFFFFFFLNIYIYPCTISCQSLHAMCAFMFSSNQPPALLAEWPGFFLCVTAYRSKSQHRKLTLEKKFFPSLWPRLEPLIFRSWVWHCKYWAIPAMGLWAHVNCGDEHSQATLDQHKVIGSSSTSSNWVLMSCQPYRVTSGQSNSGHKQKKISNIFSRMIYVSTLCRVNIQNQSLRKHDTTSVQTK